MADVKTTGLGAQISKALSDGMRGIVIAGLCLALAACQTAAPETGDKQVSTAQPVPQASAAYTPNAFAAPAQTAKARGYSEFVIDLATGREIEAVNADEPRFPASLTKMMTLYLLYEEVSGGRLSLSSPLTVSANAASRPPAKLGLKPGETITVEQAARAMAVKSANDVAVVVAEAISGSETAFARKMNQKARALGLRQTRFENASGLPDPGHVTTARDMAKLGRALKLRFPQYASFYRSRSFSFHGHTYKTTNNLLGRVAGVDGLKTGYIHAAGYNLVATVHRHGQSRLVVVMGGASEAARDRRVSALIDESF